MNPLATKPTEPTGTFLSVSYKAAGKLPADWDQEQDHIIITNSKFYITGFNKAAGLVFGLSENIFGTVTLSDAITFKPRHTSRYSILFSLFKTGSWKGEIIFTNAAGKESVFYSTASLINNNSAVVITSKLVAVNNTKDLLPVAQNTETLFNLFMENSETGYWVYDENDFVVFANDAYTDSTGFEGSPVGKHLSEIFPAKLAKKLIERNKLTLKNNKPHISEHSLTRPDGTAIHFVSNTFVFRTPDNKRYIGGQAIDITEAKDIREKLKQSDLLFNSFMKNSPALAWIYDEDGNFIFGNPLLAEKTGLTEESIGKNISVLAYSDEVAKMLFAKLRKVAKTGIPVIGEESVPDMNGVIRHYLSYWFLLPLTNGKKLVGGHAIEITDKKNAQYQIEKLYERFNYALNATSEAVWDLDLQTNEIYRSDAFYKISGYSKEQVASNINWWFDKIHPGDKERVRKSFDTDLMAGKKNWEAEYRFQYADGSYRNIMDKGFAIYDKGKPVRLIGAIQDITERKKLEAQLLNEQVKKQKLINQATIEAQEKERGMISAELHDNVNQLLMSARLHIGAAKKNDNKEDLLDKASDYLLQAVEEIRSLSKKLNTSIIKSVGLEQSIFDICRNMKQFNDITVTTDIDKDVIDKLTQEQQLVIFRIIQEQSNNIIKYSRAVAATFALTEKDNQCSLVISDNGIGFDKAKQKANGIGFINIFNRVDAYNGKVEIITYPNNGCMLNISMPYMV